jgi:hypothetical protein
MRPQLKLKFENKCFVPKFRPKQFYKIDPSLPVSDEEEEDPDFSVMNIEVTQTVDIIKPFVSPCGPFLTSPLGANFDPPGATLSPRGEF